MGKRSNTDRNVKFFRRNLGSERAVHTSVSAGRPRLYGRLVVSWTA